MKRILVISIAIVCVIIAGCVSPQAEQKNTLQFSSSPTGAEIYFDNQYQGTTPGTLTGVTTGNHTLEFRKSGYVSWHSPITVPAGPSTYYAALAPLSESVAVPATSVTESPVVVVSLAQAAVSIQADKSLITIGSTITFSGTGNAGENVLLVLYGPGAYTNGVQLIQSKVGGDGRWSYTWNPGTKVQSGSYTMVVNNAGQTASARAGFSVVGGGLTSISSARYSYGIGDTLSFSGQCTTGSRNVILTLYGPGQFSNGVSLGTQQVNADNTWTFSYQSSNSMPLGTYTMNVQDEQQTSSGSVSFSLATS